MEFLTADVQVWHVLVMIMILGILETIVEGFVEGFLKAFRSRNEEGK